MTAAIFAALTAPAAAAADASDTLSGIGIWLSLVALLGVLAIIFLPWIYSLTCGRGGGVWKTLCFLQCLSVTFGVIIGVPAASMVGLIGSFAGLFAGLFGIGLVAVAIPSLWMIAWFWAAVCSHTNNSLRMYETQRAILAELRSARAQAANPLPQGRQWQPAA
jgi:hypothetical protein